MAENPKLEYSDALSPSRVLAEMDTQKISVSDQTNGLQFTNTKPDSFAVDMDRLSHLADKDKPANSRFTANLRAPRLISGGQNPSSTTGGLSHKT